LLKGEPNEIINVKYMMFAGKLFWYKFLCGLCSQDESSDSELILTTATMYAKLRCQIVYLDFDICSLHHVMLNYIAKKKD
jgi:hypothetical protein